MRLFLLTSLCVAILFLIVLVSGGEVTSRSIPNQVAFEFALQWTIRAVGALVAISAAIGMLGVAAAREPFERQLDLALPLVGGLLLISPNWGLALAFAAIAVPWIWRWRLGRSPG